MTRALPDQAGYTLPELILGLALTALLALLAAPAMGRVLGRMQLQAAQGSLMHALNSTRSLAVLRGRRAMLCPTRDGQRCSDEHRWEGGWLMGHYRTENADQLEGPPRSVHHGHPRLTILSTTGRKRIRYQTDGSAGGSNVTFTLCRTGQVDDALTVVVSNAGRAYGAQASSDQAQQCAASR